MLHFITYTTRKCCLYSKFNEISCEHFHQFLVLNPKTSVIQIQSKLSEKKQMSHIPFHCLSIRRHPLNNLSCHNFKTNKQKNPLSICESVSNSVWLFASLTLCDPMDCIACQAPWFMEFSRQEYRSVLPFLSAFKYVPERYSESRFW